MEPHVSSIANVIQLAVAPVFLLTAVGSLLGVLTNRLARAVDRARRLEAELESLSGEVLAQTLFQLQVLSRRARWTNRAITSCTACALMVCLEVAALFVGVFLDTDLSTLAGSLFIAAMVALTLGLVSFLREVFLATRHLRIGSHRPGF
jgi:hypothetical protein